MSEYVDIRDIMLTIVKERVYNEQLSPERYHELADKLQNSNRDITLGTDQYFDYI